MAKKNIQQELASMIAKREGKKSQAKIGDVREILRIIKQIAIETMEIETKGVRTAAGENVSFTATSMVHQWLNDEMAKHARAKAAKAKRSAK